MDGRVSTSGIHPQTAQKAQNGKQEASDGPLPPLSSSSSFSFTSSPAIDRHHHHHHHHHRFEVGRGGGGMQDAAILGGLAADGPGDAGRENLPNIDYPSSRSTRACTLKTDWSTLW
ncbi:hypothetical protein CDEST_00886 [Colletotrichum destructivum]|uniref:Uncharacterized protein n=1 Tax=Colletotrichum destructivum TaxID=34406 RepID=A0AAX4HYL2_9PEZI|nr:hypothetical protein CDEST_00886 [Colletotrichum destructivum]